MKLIREIQRNPFEGSGKPEPVQARIVRLLLKADYAGKGSGFWLAGIIIEDIEDVGMSLFEISRARSISTG